MNAHIDIIYHGGSGHLVPQFVELDEGGVVRKRQLEMGANVECEELACVVGAPSQA